MSVTVGGLLDSLRPAADEERRAWAVACAQVLKLGGIAVTVGELHWSGDPADARPEDLRPALEEGFGLPRNRSDVRQAPGPGRLRDRRWLRSATEAEELGGAAMSVRPVHIGAVRAGTMTGRRRTPGPLTARQPVQGRPVADGLAGQSLRNRPAAATHNDHGHDEGRDAGRRHGHGRGRTGAVPLHRAKVRQATGALGARRGIPPAEALDRLRHRAHVLGRSLTDTAQEVIERELPR